MLNKQVSKFMIRLVLFIVILIVIDVCFGFLFSSLLKKQTDGRFFKIAYTLDKANEDIIIIGSSRAETNYNPAIITPKTGLSCWNAGRGGQGIPYHLAMEEEILSRTSPKIIVLNMDPDGLIGPVDYDKASILRPFSKNHSVIHTLLSQKDKAEKYKLHSNIYTYNSMLFYFIRPFFIKGKDGDPEEKGWKPRRGIIPQSAILQKEQALLQQQADTLNPEKVLMLNRMVDNANKKNVKLLIVFSPDYYPVKHQTATMTYIAQLSRQKQFVVFDFTKAFIENPAYFYDLNHMNEQGANAFSLLLSDSIAKIN